MDFAHLSVKKITNANAMKRVKDGIKFTLMFQEDKNNEIPSIEKLLQKYTALSIRN